MSFGELIDTALRPKKARPNGKTSLTAGKIFPEVADEDVERAIKDDRGIRQK